MNLFKLLIYVGANLLCAFAAPVNTFSEIFNSSRSKCPSLFQTSLVKLDLFRNCSYERLKTLNNLSESNAEDIRCLLYYNQVEYLCEKPYNNSTYNETLTSQKLQQLKDNLTSICQLIRSSEYVVNDTKEAMEALKPNVDTKCEFLCNGLDGIKELCSYTAFLISAIKELHTVELSVTSIPATITSIPESKIEIPVASNVTSPGANPVLKENEKTPEVEKFNMPSSTTSVKVEHEVSSIKASSKEFRIEEAVDSLAEIKTPDKVKQPSTESKMQEHEVFEHSEDEKKIKIDPAIPILEDVSENKQSPMTDDAQEYPADEDLELTEQIESSKINKANTQNVEKKKPHEIDEDSMQNSVNYQSGISENDSYFFSYFMMVSIVFILAYVGYHNKQKLFALVVEGRQGRRQSRGRRPNSANYRKLDSNLEEAVTSSCSKTAANVIY